MSAFDEAFAIVVGSEGGFTQNTNDPGNWTGGACGRGECRGTNWGISASAYPALDIAALSKEQASAIYLRDYWQKIGADDMPAPLALLAFDAAVNNGIGHAIRWLQTALGIPADGRLGPQTLAALAASAGHGATVLAEFQALRTVYMTSLPSWSRFGLGWARRLCRLPFQAVQMR